VSGQSALPDTQPDLSLDRFLGALLPSRGLLCRVTFAGGHVSHTFYSTVSELAVGVAQADARGDETYFACASYTTNASRKASNVATARSLWVDVDCGPGKPYPDQCKGVAALDKFRRKLGLPWPWIVNSGNGIHAYFALDVDVPAAKWTVLASKFKRACEVHDFYADPSRTADIASLLRPPGTSNLKGARCLPVSVLKKGGVGSLADVELALEPYAAAVVLAAAPSSGGALGPVPAYMAAIPFSPGANDELGGIHSPDLAKIADALDNIPAAALRPRDDWRNVLLNPLAHEAALYPASEPKLKALLHKYSSALEAFVGCDGFDDGYNTAANDKEWRAALASTRAALADGKSVSTIGSLFRAAKQHGWGDSVSTTAAPATGSAPAISGAVESVHLLPTVCMAELAGTVVPPREWVVPGWIPSRAATLIVGPGGAGKSLFVQQLLTCISQGIPCLSLPASEAVPTLLINCEEERNELTRRGFAIADAIRAPVSDLVGVHTLSRVGELGNEVGTFDAERKIHLSDFYNQIEATALDKGARVVALDNIAHLYAGNENDRSEVTQFVNALSRLAIKIDGAVILVGHPAKGAGSEYSGSTAWENAVRSRLFMQRLDKVGDDEPDPNVRVLTRSKTNYSAVGDAVEMRWDRGAFVQHLTGLTKPADDKIADGTFLRCLAKFIAEKRPVSASRHAHNYAPKEFSWEGIAGGFKARALEAAMRRLSERGAIALDERLWRRANRSWACGISLVDPAQVVAASD
jgi:KaiC/GvpD/RAD55 family RecA-like ATPase